MYRFDKWYRYNEWCLQIYILCTFMYIYLYCEKRCTLSTHKEKRLSHQPAKPSSHCVLWPILMLVGTHAKPVPHFFIFSLFIFRGICNSFYFRVPCQYEIPNAFVQIIIKQKPMRKINNQRK